MARQRHYKNQMHARTRAKRDYDRLRKIIRDSEFDELGRLRSYIGAKPEGENITAAKLEDFSNPISRERK